MSSWRFQWILTNSKVDASFDPLYARDAIQCSIIAYPCWHISYNFQWLPRQGCRVLQTELFAFEIKSSCEHALERSGAAMCLVKIGDARFESFLSRFRRSLFPHIPRRKYGQWSYLTNPTDYRRTIDRSFLRAWFMLACSVLEVDLHLAKLKSAELECVSRVRLYRRRITWFLIHFCGTFRFDWI